MVEPLRHRQTKGAATDMPGLPPPRHIPTLPTAATQPSRRERLFLPHSGHWPMRAEEGPMGWTPATTSVDQGNGGKRSAEGGETMGISGAAHYDGFVL